VRTILSCVLFFLVTAVGAHAGPVNSPGSFPFAAMNSTGDAVFAGNWKLRVSWQGDYSERSDAAAPFRFSGAGNDFFSGGISENVFQSSALSNEQDVAIVCAGKQVALFSPIRTPAFPAGRWREIRDVAGVPLGEAKNRCAMRRDGLFAVFQASEHRVIMPSGEVVPLPSAVSAAAAFLVVGDNFAVVTPKQIFWVSPTPGGGRVSEPQFHGFGALEEFTSFAANEKFVLKADATSVLVAPIVQNSVTPFLALGAPSRLPISPCSENEMCGAWLASDNSWAVSGFWGTYVGVNHAFVRLRLPNFSQGEGGVAFAHSHQKGRYVYIGADDGDAGTLSDWAEPFSEANVLSAKPMRYMVWTKFSHDKEWTSSRPSDSSVLFPWIQNRRGARERVQKNAYGTFVHTGPLPRKIPKHWVAWEREQVLHWNLPRSGQAFTENVLQGEEPGWWARAIRAPQALDFALQQGLKAQDVVVGIVDSGVQVSHPWLENSFAVNAAEIPENGLDDDNNGFVDDVFGYDFVGEDSSPDDLFGHGTHVAGLVAGRFPVSGNPVGVNSNIRIRVARALDQAGKSNSIDLSRALAYLVHSDVDIVNCSWGGGPVTQSLRDAFAYAVDSHVLVISSAGNDRVDTDKHPQVPKMFPGVVPVGAYTDRGGKAPFSNWGKNSVQWFAPGDKIVSSLPGSLLGEKSGTSMASPIAASIAGFVMGVLWEKNPHMARAEVVSRVKSAVCASGNAAGLKNMSVCGGIDALRALENSQFQ
jgi:hypothetical protein